jgi:NTP pyrophosphatase (non-canonical NTP hydrolase)
VARAKRSLLKPRRKSGRRAKAAPDSATPFDLAAFQARIAATYGAKDAARGLPGTFMYLAEEVGELAEALREPAKHDLSGEFADCLAWLVSLAHLAGVELAAAAAKKYPGICGCCGRTPCTCRTKP